MTPVSELLTTKPQCCNNHDMMIANTYWTLVMYQKMCLARFTNYLLISTAILRGTYPHYLHLTLGKTETHWDVSDLPRLVGPELYLSSAQPQSHHTNSMPFCCNCVLFGSVFMEICICKYGNIYYNTYDIKRDIQRANTEEYCFVNFFLFLLFCLMWTIFKVFIEFVTILLLFHVLVFWPRGMWDLSSLTRDWTCTPSAGRQSLNHWTAREIPCFVNFDASSLMLIFGLYKQLSCNQFAN